MNFYRLMAGAASFVLGGMTSMVEGVAVPVTDLRRRSSFGGQKRDWTKTRSRYMPHQGPRECSRRVRQMKRAAL